jgi:hypothetical protein
VDVEMLKQIFIDLRGKVNITNESENVVVNAGQLKILLDVFEGIAKAHYRIEKEWEDEEKNENEYAAAKSMIAVCREAQIIMRTANDSEDVFLDEVYGEES